MIDEGATHFGVATDHVIESFRNDLWNGYKTGEGIDPALFAQFEPLEDALRAMGIAVWAMVDLEADDALLRRPRSRRRMLASRKSAFGRRIKISRNAFAEIASCRSIDGATSFGMPSACERSSVSAPNSSPTISRSSATLPMVIPASRASARRARPPCLHGMGRSRNSPRKCLASSNAALLFKELATLRTDAKLFADVDELEWRGPTAGFPAICERLDAPNLLARATRAAQARAP